MSVDTLDYPNVGINALAANGIGDPIFAKGFRNINFTAGSTNNGEFKIRVLGATKLEKPDFSSPAVPGNGYSSLELRKTEFLKSEIEFTGTDFTECYAVNTDNYNWIAFEVFDYIAGNATVEDLSIASNA